MARPLFKWERWIGALLLMRLSAVGVAMLTMMLSACHKNAGVDSSVRADEASEKEAICGDEWVKTLASCPMVHEQADREHMIAVLQEQMNGLSKQDKQRRCQELNGFWQVACGVTSTR